MKNTIYFIAVAFFLCSFLANAQQFSPTTGLRCANCVPANYSATGTPFISDVDRPGLTESPIEYYWDIYLSLADTPPSLYSQQLPAGQGKNSFVTLKTSEGALNDQLYLDVSGFDVTKTYTFRYSVCALSLYNITDGLPDPPYAESATMQISTVGQNPNVLVASQTTNFDANNKKKWTTRVLTFQPLASTLRFKLSGKTSGQAPGYVHFSIDKYPFECNLAQNLQVVLGQSSVSTIFPGDKLDLTSVRIDSDTPPNTEIVWKTNPNSTYPSLTAQQASSVSISNLDPALPKTYYAFYFSPSLNCHTTSVSQAALNFLYTPTQVPLKQTYSAVSCGQPTTNLTTLLNDPVGPVYWFTTNNHQSGSQVQNPQAVGPGNYYAFYFDGSKGGYSLPANQVSTAHVKVENPIAAGTPDLGPTMNINSLIFPPNGSKDFVVKMENIKAENSNCTVFFKVSKLPGFSISYNTTAGQSNVNGGIGNNNDLWTFTEDAQYITVTAKGQISELGYSYIGFKLTRNANTPAGSKQNLAVTIPLPGGGGETNASNNQTITTLMTN